MSTKLPFPVYLPNCQIIDCQTHQQGYILVAHSIDKQASCPLCQQVSSRLHGFYYRKPTDLPISDKAVQLRLRLRRFRCLNPVCPKRTFGQPCPDWSPAFARRTNRLAHAQRSVAMMLGGQAGARLLTHLYMPTSHDTLVRLIRKWQPGDPQTPHALGVDDCRAAGAGDTKNENLWYNSDGPPLRLIQISISPSIYWKAEQQRAYGIG